MAAQVAWQISFPGLDQQITKLQQMKVLIDSISRGVSGLGGVGGRLGTIPGGGTVFLPGGAGTSTGTSALGTAAGAALGAGAASINQQSMIRDALQRAGFMRGNVGGSAGGQSAYNVTQMGKEFMDKMLPSLTKYVGKPGYSSPIGPGMAFGEKWAGIKESIKKDFSGGLGGLRGAMSTAAGGGGIGGVVTALAGGFGKLFPIIGAVILAFGALHKVIKLLEEGIRHGAEAYQTAARQARSIRESVTLKQAFAEVGLVGGEEAAMTAMAQFNPRAKRTGVPGTSEVIGALRAAQFANIQQIVNMSEEFAEAMRMAEGAARQTEKAAKATQKESSGISAIGMEWKTLLTQLAAVTYPVIRLFEVLVIGLFRVINTVLEPLIRLGQLLHLIPEGVPGTARIAGMNKSGGATAWEKIGFQFGTGKVTAMEETMEETAHNTKTIAVNTTLIANALRGNLGAIGVLGAKLGANPGMRTGIMTGLSVGWHLP